jgi:hypothetical protein
MVRWKAFVLVAAVVIGGFFNVGCRGLIKDRAGDAMEGLLERGKEWVKAEVATALPKIEEKLEAIAEKKLLEQEEKYNAAFDVHLAKVAPDDPVTGGKAAKTWKDFDIDKSGHLEPLEVGRVTAYILTEGPKRVAEGKISAEEWSDTQKNVAKGGTAAAAIATAALYVRNRRKKKEAQGKTEVAAAGPEPKPPGPASPSPAPAGG